LRMELTNLVSGLTLSPVTTGEEPFILSYLMPLQLDAISYWSYIPVEPVARHRVLQLFENGNEVDNPKVDRQTNGTYLVQWNTAYGLHTLQMRLSFDVHNPYGSAHISGPERTENITWRIEDSTNFFQWGKSTGLGLEQARLHGALQVPQADYKILFYDTNSVFLKTIGGHTDKGVIDEVWDLKTSSGELENDSELKAKVYIWPRIGGTNDLAGTNATLVFGPYFYHLAR